MCGPQRREGLTEVEAGYWAAEAARLGVVVRPVEGLRGAEIVTAAGSPPLFLLPAWAEGAMREYMIAWGLCELHRRSLGIEDARRQIARAVATLTATAAD